jgi:hypothetical protein
VAFDHARILADVRPVLADRLWARPRIHRGPSRPRVQRTDRAGVTASLTGGDVDRGNLNRTLKRIAVRVDDPPRPASGDQVPSGGGR